jgi:ABC-type polysaccharide/polyol phosphate export permease
MGLAYLTAATQVFIQDLSHALGPLFTIWFFATPIIYPENLIPENMRALLAFNPMVQLLRPIRGGLLGGGYSYTLSDLLVLLVCVAVLFVGLRYFRRLSRHFEDFL